MKPFLCVKQLYMWSCISHLRAIVKPLLCEEKYTAQTVREH